MTRFLTDNGALIWTLGWSMIIGLIALGGAS